jgi:acyl-CoA thioesterase I
MTDYTPCFGLQPIFRWRGLITSGLFFLFLVFTPLIVEGETPPVILAFGDSLTAGHGVQQQGSYPSRLQVILQEKGYPHRVVNAGVSGDTTAGGVRRISWLLKHKPSIVILALGANDGLRGLAIPEMYSNLKMIIEICQEHNARVLLAGMKIPPNFGEKYSQEFVDVYSRLSREFEIPLLPFLLEGVAAKREYTQADGIHPLSSGYKIVTATVWKHLEPMLSSVSSK